MGLEEVRPGVAGEKHTSLDACRGEQKLFEKRRKKGKNSNTEHVHYDWQ